MVEDTVRSLGSYKDALTSLFLQDEDIVNIIMPELDDDRFDVEENWLGGNYKYIDENKKVNYVELSGHCFDVPYVSDVVKNAYSYICMDTSIRRIENDSIKDVQLVITVFANKPSVHMSKKEKAKYLAKGYSGNRIDMAVQAIVNCVNRANEKDSEWRKEFGIGRMRLTSSNAVIPLYPSSNSDFFGKTITFVCPDFYIKSSKK